MPDLFVSSEKSPKKAHGHADTQSHAHPHHHSTHQVPPLEQRRKMPGYNAGPLSAYCYYPSNVKFFNKDAEEKIVLVLRRHPITNITWILVATLMLLAPLFVDVSLVLGFLPKTFQTMGLVIWYLITTAFIFEEFLSWYFNVNIVTDERIFDVDFHNLLYREITDAKIEQIQDVTVRVGSVVRTLFNFGDVLIQTASEVPNIEFSAVPHPDLAAKILRDLGVEEEIEKVEGRVR